LVAVKDMKLLTFEASDLEKVCDSPKIPSRLVYVHWNLLIKASFSIYLLFQV
jgi:hypothetical protein